MFNRSITGSARVIGASVVVGAVVLAVLPFLAQCTAGITLADGKTVPMKCHWTAMAAIATAIPLGLVGLSTFVGRRNETLRVLGLLTAGLGSMAVLLPTVLIGVCANPDHTCNILMRPAMVLTGVLMVAAGVTLFVLTRTDAEAVA